MQKKIDDRSYGIIPFYFSGNKCQFLLIEHQKKHWGFPKGHEEEGETKIATASREFSEETGITDFTVYHEVEFTEHYSFRKKNAVICKEVVYYLAKVHCTTVCIQVEEIKDYCWLTYQDATQRLTFPESKRMLLQANRYILEHQISEKYS